MTALRILPVVGLLGLALAAEAHPLSKDKYSFRTALRLDGAELDAVVVLEVPFDVVRVDVAEAMKAAKTSDDPAGAAEAVLDGYRDAQFAAIADGLRLTVDGEAVPGRWVPRDNRLNGKASVAGGFFMYIVEFQPKGALELDDDVTVRVDNQGYPEAPMVYSAMVLSGEGWSLASQEPDVLPDGPYDLNDPRFWVEDPRLRKVGARWTRAKAP